MIIGIAGKSGSGKNFIAEILEKEYGFFHIDTDCLAHQVLEQKSADVEKAFEIRLKKDKKGVDRRELSSIVFSDPQKLKILESIIYPCLQQRILALIKENPKALINGAKILESGCQDFCDAIFWVQAFKFIRLRRLVKRDGLQKKAILKRFKAQKKLSAQPWKKTVDIYKINNNKSSSQVRRKVDLLLKKLERGRYLHEK